ncbi:phage shock protein operon transcriptional activator [Thiolapillus brandeum]|uniref:Psp operon transcriptional activator n=1 Tax=Thiolapillus brandeum TaxID=1076588 RepID=A0A7U6JHQ6_9GAMM|nr:phage shock protein operon transcriptional activator [Thiolapillus brandeum]BAO43943.1 psp operon transcriptional activator [Thiolapillus brandeum]
MAEHQKLIGQSSAFLETLERISMVAPLSKPVLIIGERGTGKEMMVERLHFLSSRWENVLVKVNCAALPENLLESELFGYEAGAFTGAGKRHVGRFERAHHGTLFLDEIASMSLRLQEKLLRVIEYGEFERVGGDATLTVDVRVVGAANVDLPAMADRGEFRADLLDRLSFDVITLPPLRYRKEDIPLLAEHFALGMTRELQRPFFAGFTEQGLEQMQAYPWPGNIRELKNVVERAVYRTVADEPVSEFEFNPFASPWQPVAGVEVDELPEADSAPPVVPEQHISRMNLPVDLKAHIREYEQDILRKSLESNRFNQRRTARALGLTYAQLRGYLKKYGISVKH